VRALHFSKFTKRKRIKSQNQRGKGGVNSVNLEPREKEKSKRRKKSSLIISEN
jgi:hypothetical protein